MSVTRREFVKTSVAIGAALSVPAVSASQRGKKYRTALIGSGWWGQNILREALRADQSKLVAMCDVDQNQLDLAAKEMSKLTGDEFKHYGDYRELLDKEKPEIVIVATPDHWHPLIMIAAVEAGAHVYVEKPIGHTILECVAMVKAARDTDRVVQVGTHRRVSPHNVSGMKFLKEGRAGKIGMVRAFVHYPGDQARRRLTQNRPKVSIGTCGVAQRPCAPLIARSIQRDSGLFWITRTANLATGGFIGWTRSSGGLKRNTRATSIRPGIVTSSRTAQLHPIRRLSLSSSNLLLPPGSTAS